MTRRIRFQWRYAAHLGVGIYCGMAIISAGAQTVDLRKSLEEALAKLPDLTLWQRTLSTEEIIPQFQRFIQDYQTTEKGLKIQVDLESVKKYLAFYAPQALKLPKPQLLLWANSDPNCGKCVENLPAIRKLIQSRVENRGFIPVWLRPQELRPQELRMDSGEAPGVHGQPGTRITHEQMTALVKKKGTAGAWTINWAPAATEDEDSAHGDEKQIRIESNLLIGEFFQNQEKDFVESDDFQTVTQRVMTDLWIDLGSKVASNSSTGVESGEEEVTLEVSGIRDFSAYSQLKNRIFTHLKDFSVLIEDRKFSKGQVVFAIYTKLNKEALKKQMSLLMLNSNEDSPVRMVIR